MQHPIVSRELLEQVDSLMDQAVPGFTLLVFEGSISESAPFLKKGGRTIFLLKQSCQSFLKAAAKDHCGASLLLPPSIEIAVAIAARAAQVVADLGVARRSRLVSLPLRHARGRARERLPLACPCEGIQVLVGAAVDNRVRGAHDTLQIQKCFYIHLVMAQ